MCGPDHPAPDGDYSTHEGIVAAMADENYVTEDFDVPFKTAAGADHVYKSFITYRKDAGPRPVVLVLPNYAGLKQFDKDQAVFLAKLGYVGLAVELFHETEDYKHADRNPVVETADGETGGEFASQYSRTVQSKASDYVNAKDAKVMECKKAVHPPDSPLSRWALSPTGPTHAPARLRRRRQTS